MGRVFTYQEIMLAKKARKIKPLVKKGLLARLSFVEEYEIKSFKFQRYAKVVCKAPKLKKIAVISTVHAPVGYYDEFAPSIAEVLSQIPQGLADKAVAFSVKEKSRFGSNFNKTQISAKTTLYALKNGEKMPTEVADQPVIVGGKKLSAKEIDVMTL